MTYSRVTPPYWSEVWIVGGGPSARNFDYEMLRGKTILAVNDAVFVLSRKLFLPSSVTVFSLDNNWIRRHRDFLEGYEGEKWFALPDTWPDCFDITGAKYLQWSHEDGLNEDPSFVNTGCNSGYGALNLAYHKQATDIHLIGYDMDPKDNENYAFWAPMFRHTVGQLYARGIRVSNHNKDSHIDAFELV